MHEPLCSAHGLAWGFWDGFYRMNGRGRKTRPTLNPTARDAHHVRTGEPWDGERWRMLVSDGAGSVAHEWGNDG